MDDIQQLQDINNFFYYGQQDLAFENKYDVYSLILQGTDKLFYARDFGGGVSNYLNFPVGFMIDIGVKFAIANAIAKRNQTVTDGRNNSKDRQVLVSQSSIDVDHSTPGEVNVNVQYFNKFDLSNTQTLASLGATLGVSA